MRRSITKILQVKNHYLRLFAFLAILLPGANVVHAQYWTISYCSSAPATNLGSNTYGPMYSTSTANATNRIAVIYPSSQLAGIAGQTLTSAYFYRKTTTGSMAGTPNFKIYLKEVSAADWGSGSLSWTTATTGATLVYDANPATIVGSTGGWKSFSFSNNFTYSGTQNLAVFMEYTNATASTALDWAYEYTGSCVTTTNSNTTKYSNVTSGILPASLGSSNYRRPYIGFDYVVAPCWGSPTAGTLDVTTQTLCTGVTPATISATGYTLAPGITYQWQESLDDGNGFPWANVTGGTGGNTPSFTPPSYAGNQIYYRLLVTCMNGGGTDATSSSVINSMGTPGSSAGPIAFTNVSNTSMTVGWTNGSGNRRYVVINTTNSFTDPVDGTTGPTVAGTAYSGSGEQIVYDGTGTSVTVSGLSCNTTYYARVYEYQRCGTATPYTYFFNTAPVTNNPASQATVLPSAVALPVSNNFAGFTGSNLTTVMPGWYEAKVTTSAGSQPSNVNPQTTNSIWTYSTDLGSATARINLYTNSRNEWIVSPLMTVASASRLRFKAAITDYASASADPSGMQGTDDSVHVLISTDGCGLIWTPVYTFHAGNTSSLSNTLKDFFIPLASYTGQNIQVAFQATDGPTDNTPDYDFHIGNVVIEPTPACDVPSNITASSVGITTATVSWSPSLSLPANGYDYFRDTTSATPGTAVTPTGSITNDTTTALSGLSGSTLYYVWVRSNCGGSTSAWEGPVSFRTTPANDNCAGAITLVPAGGTTCTTTTSGTTIAATQSAETAPSCGATGVNDDVWYKFTATSVAHKITLSNVSGSTDMAMALYSGSCGSLTAMQCSDPNTFDALGLTVGATYYIRVWTYTSTATTRASFDICVSTISCPYPTAANATNVSTNSANLGWTANGSSSWEVEYGLGSFTQGTGTRFSTSSNPYTLQGLTSATAYSYFVRSVCGVGDTSAWTSRVTFTTDCVPATLPYTEDFATYAPSCWSERTGTLGNSTVLSGATSAWVGDDWLNTAANGKAAKINLYLASKNDWLVSPTIDLGSGGNYQLQFDVAFADFGHNYNLNIGSDDTLAVVISTNNGVTWSAANILQMWTTATSGTLNQTVSIPLTGYSGLVKIGFYASEGAVDDTNDVDVMIDNFQVLGTPLAITLTGVHATNDGAKNRVDWTTASELHGDYFELERSTDGKSFDKIATINAKGESSSYVYWDEAPVNGINYYRLKMLTASGQFTYSKVVSASVAGSSNFSVQVYPNPVSDQLNIKINGEQGNGATISVLDISGKTVKTLSANSNFLTVDMSEFVKGVYIIRYSDNKHQELIKLNKQ